MALRPRAEPGAFRHLNYVTDMVPESILSEPHLAAQTVVWGTRNTRTLDEAGAGMPGLVLFALTLSGSKPLFALRGEGALRGAPGGSLTFCVHTMPRQA